MAGNSARYERKLSGIERYSMAINEVYPYNVIPFVIGRGHIDLEALRAAVATAAQANPGMRVRLKSYLGFAKWVDSGIAPEVIAIDAPQWDFHSSNGADFLLKRFEPLAGGPIADVMLVRGADKVAVVFRGLHAAVDGRGMLHWLQEVFRALRGEALIGGESTLADFEVAERFRDKFPAEEKKEKSKSEAPPPYIPVLPPSASRDAELRYIWRTVSIPRRLTTILPRAAVYLARCARQHGDGMVGFTVPVDYRGLRVEASSTGNLTGYLRIAVGPEDTPKNIMQQLNQQMRDYVDCRLPLMALPLRWIPMRLIVRKLRKDIDTALYTPNADLPSGGLVSMGHTDADSCSTSDFKCELGIGIPGAVGKINVVAVNYPDFTLVTFSVPNNYNRDGQFDALVESFVAEFSQ